jgi:hypothetical protein
LEVFFFQTEGTSLLGVMEQKKICHESGPKAKHDENMNATIQIMLKEFGSKRILHEHSQFRT